MELDTFGQAGVQLGYAGPDYFARHGGDFVGYEYVRGGPVAFALRFAMGISLRWANGLLDCPTLTFLVPAAPTVVGALRKRRSGRDAHP